MSTSNWETSDLDDEDEGIGDEGGLLDAPGGEGGEAVGDMGDGVEATLPDEDEPGAM